MRRTGKTLIGLTVVALIVFGCSTKTPDRDHIPVLKNKLYELQQAVVNRNRAAMDSLMSVEILDEGLSSDSLLSYVYGSNGDFDFTQFGNAEFFYTREKARVDCYVMDSTKSDDRPITFTLLLDNGRWLFKRFEPGLPRLTDSLLADSSASE